MIVEKILVKGQTGFAKWFDSKYRKETTDILTKSLWTQENTLRLYYYEDIDACVIRGSDSIAKPEIPIGTLTTSQLNDGNNVWFDDPYWAGKFGKTCVFTNDGPIYELLISGKREEIHPSYTENNLITKVAMGRIFDALHIPFEFLPDADVVLLPSRDKFACGYSRAMYLRPEDKGKAGVDMVRYEGGWISYFIDHALFQSILPEDEYLRNTSSDPEHGGIDGIENKFPSFDREAFYTAWFEEIANILGEDSRNITIINSVIK